MEGKCTTGCAGKMGSGIRIHSIKVMRTMGLSESDCFCIPKGLRPRFMTLTSNSFTTEVPIIDTVIEVGQRAVVAEIL